MNAIPLAPLHFRVQNGSHAVLLCAPSLLASRYNSVPLRSLTTCRQCIAALAEDDQIEIMKRMQSK